MSDQNNNGANDGAGSVWEPRTISIFGEDFTVELKPRVTPLAQLYDDPDRPDDPSFLVGINRRPQPGDDPLRQLFESYRPDLPEGPIYDQDAAARQRTGESLTRDGVQMELVGKVKTWTLSLAVAPPTMRGLPDVIERAPDGCGRDGCLRIRGVARYRDDPTDYYVFYIEEMDTADEDRIRIAVSQKRQQKAELQAFRKDGTQDSGPFDQLPTAKVKDGDWREITLSDGKTLTFSERRVGRGQALRAIWEYCRENSTCEFQWGVVQGNYNRSGQEGGAIAGRRLDHDVFAGEQDDLKLIFARLGQKKEQRYKLLVRFKVT
ncbi:MAG: hypothetical protein FJ222_11085 [Lentisphaerae bacterium]|nr:hypothetical protein [Lentisphaerota bacterium]